MSITFKKIFLLVAILFCIAGHAFSINIDAYQLFFRYDHGLITFEGCKKVNKPINKILWDARGWKASFYDSQETIVFKTRIRDPRIVYYDKITPDGNMEGGMILKEVVVFSVFVPSAYNVNQVKFTGRNTYQENERLQNSINSGIQEIGKTNVYIDLPYDRIFPPLENARILGVEKIIDNGPDDSRINFAILAEEFSESEMGEYRNYVNGLFYKPYENKSLEGNRFFRRLIDKPPFKEALKFYNFYRVDIADFPSNWPAQLDLSGNDPQQIWLNDYLKAYIPGGVDSWCALMRTPTYFGTCGAASRLSMQVDVLCASDDYPDIFLHELGHMLYGGDLGDEYEREYCEGRWDDDSDMPANWDLDTEKSKIKWNNWIDDSTPLPTPEENSYKYVVGAFQGALYDCIYRPQLTCIMREARIDFCNVCLEAFSINLIQGLCNPIQGTTQNYGSNERIITEKLPEIKLAVKLDRTFYEGTENPTLEWFIDGTHVSEYDNQSEVVLETKMLAPGVHEVKVQIDPPFLFWKDLSKYIRKEFSLNNQHIFDKFEITKGIFLRKR